MAKMYLYNGLEFPELPNDVDRTVWDFACITEYKEGEANHLLITKSTYKDTDYGVCYKTNVADQNKGVFFYGNDTVVRRYEIQNGEWVFAEQRYKDEGATGVGFYYDMPIWTNTTIRYSTTEDVFLESSEPVPVSTFDLKSWLTGFALGLAGTRQPVGRMDSEPIDLEAMSGDYMMYNHVKLPRVPYVGSSKYPYSAVILLSTGIKVISTSKRATYRVANGQGSYYLAPYSGIASQTFDPNTLELTQDYVNPSLSTWRAVCDKSQIIWANYDILGSDDTTVCVQKSPDPTPLDGMTVVEWDGDTEGLEMNVNGMYLLSKVTPTGSGNCVLVKDGVLYTDIRISMVNSSVTEKRYEFTQTDGTILALYDGGLWVMPGVTLIAYLSNCTASTYTTLGWLTGRQIIGRPTLNLPIMAASDTWLNGCNVAKTKITSVTFCNDYTPTGNESCTWSVDHDSKGLITGYANGTDLTICTNGYGRVFANEDSSYMFDGMTKLKSINGLTRLDTRKVVNMSGMFRNCYVLQTLDVSKFDTSNVTDMSEMFCSNSYYTSLGSAYHMVIPTLDLSGFDTSKVTNMRCMFRRCAYLTGLDVGNFNTSNVTNMEGMFGVCRKLETLDVSNFNTSEVTSMAGMFAGCNALASIDVSNFDTGKVTDMTGMFGGCNVLTSIDVSNFNTSKVTSIANMFGSCAALESIDLSSFDTSNVTDMMNTFADCKGLKALDVTKFDTSKVKSMRYMFCNIQLSSIDLSSFDTSNVTNMGNMFEGSSIVSIDLSNFITTKVTDMSSMFYKCSELTTLNLTSFDTSKVEEAYLMFCYASKLETIYVSDKWDMSRANTNDNMFYECGTSSVTVVAN